MPFAPRMGGEAEKVLPIDRIEFEPTFSTTTGAFEPQLTLGKDLTQDLSASVGQTFGVASRTRVEINYRLGPRVWLLGSWESQTETEAGAFTSCCSVFGTRSIPNSLIDPPSILAFDGSSRTSDRASTPGE